MTTFRLAYLEMKLHLRSAFLYWCGLVALIFGMSRFQVQYPSHLTRAQAVAEQFVWVFGVIYVFWMARLFLAESVYDTENLVASRPTAGERLYAVRFLITCTVALVLLLGTAGLQYLWEGLPLRMAVVGDYYSFILSHAGPSLVFAAAWTLLWASVWRNPWGVFLLGLIPWHLSDRLQFSESIWAFFAPYLMPEYFTVHSLLTGYGEVATYIYANRAGWLAVALGIGLLAASVMSRRREMSIRRSASWTTVLLGVAAVALAVVAGLPLLDAPTAAGADQASARSATQWAAAVNEGTPPRELDWEEATLTGEDHTVHIRATPLDMTQARRIAPLVASHQALFPWQWDDPTGEITLAEVPGWQDVAVSGSVVTVSERLFRLFRGDDLERTFIRRLNLALWARRGGFRGGSPSPGGIPETPAYALLTRDPVRAGFALYQDWVFLAEQGAPAADEKKSMQTVFEHTRPRMGPPPHPEETFDAVTDDLMGRGVQLWRSGRAWPEAYVGLQLQEMYNRDAGLRLLRTAWESEAFRAPGPIVGDVSELRFDEFESRWTSTISQLEDETGGDGP